MQRFAHLLRIIRWLQWLGDGGPIYWMREGPHYRRWRNGFAAGATWGCFLFSPVMLGIDRIAPIGPSELFWAIFVGGNLAFGFICLCLLLALTAEPPEEQAAPHRC